MKIDREINFQSWLLFFIGQAAAYTTTGNHTRIGTCTLRPGKCIVSFSWVARNKLQVVISLMSFAFCAVSWLLDFLCCGNSCRLRHPLSGRILGTFGAPNPSLTHPFVWLSHKKIDVLKRRWSKQTDNGWQWHQMPSNSLSLNNQLTNGFESTICQKWPDLVPRLLSAAQVQPVNGRVSGKYASVTQSSARTAGKLGVWLSADNICVIDVSDNGSRGQE